MNWNKVGPPGTSWNYLEPPETTYNMLELSRTTYNKMDLAMNRHRKTRNLYEETVLEIPLPNKMQHQQQLLTQRAPSQMFLGGTTWSRMKPVTSQYNTISLQPTVTKSSILDINKVTQIWLFIYALNKKAKQLSMKIRLIISNIKFEMCN